MKSVSGRFGVIVSWQGATIDGMIPIAEEAERLGCEYFWVPEAWGLEAFSACSLLLSRTKRMRIGAGVVNVYSRSAALIGMACATMDQISPGRFLLGLGASGRGLVQDWHGIHFEKPLKRTEEYVKVIKMVSRGETLNFSGETIRNDLSRFRLHTRPMNSGPEIFLGAISETNLRLAGRIADGAILATYPISKLGFALDCVMAERGAEERKKSLLFAYYSTLVRRGSGYSGGQEDAKAEEHLRGNIAFYISSMGSYYARNLSRLGFAEDVKSIILARERSGSEGARSAVSERLVSELALIGTPDEIAERVEKEIPRNVIPVLGFSARSAEEVASSIRSLRSLFLR